MGEHAEDILEGRVCQTCGEWFHDEEPGHPRDCLSCLVVGTGAVKKRRKKANYKRNRAARVETANKSGLTKEWTQHDKYHYSRRIGGLLVQWWPSANKYMVTDGPKRIVARITQPSDMKIIVEALKKGDFSI